MLNIQTFFSDKQEAAFKLKPINNYYKKYLKKHEQSIKLNERIFTIITKSIMYDNNKSDFNNILIAIEFSLQNPTQVYIFGQEWR